MEIVEWPEESFKSHGGTVTAVDPLLFIIIQIKINTWIKWETLRSEESSQAIRSCALSSVYSGIIPDLAVRR